MGGKALQRTNPREVPFAVEDASPHERLIHEKTRLGIVCALAVNESLSFQDLKRALKTSDGNLSVHARKLENAKYISAEKSFHDRIPRTTYSLTEKGRDALQRYLDHMQALIEATRR